MSLAEEHGCTVESTHTVKNLLKKYKDCKKFTWNEVKQARNEKGQLWVVIEGAVFDITPMYKSGKHPGGNRVLRSVAGRDCTESFVLFHPESVHKFLPKYFIGRVLPISGNNLLTKNGEALPNDISASQLLYESKILTDFHRIRQIFLECGMFETDMNYYYKKFGYLGAMFVVALSLTLLTNSFYAHMAGAVFLGIFWQQLAFIGHDAGHNAVSHSRRLDYEVCVYVGDFLMGIGMGWWKLSHNVHHINCNSITNDPDIQHMPVFAVDKRMLGGFFSTYHSKIFPYDKVAKFLVSYQHLLFYPVMMVARFNLYLQSWLLVLDSIARGTNDAEYAKIELISLAGFMTWLVALALSLPSIYETAAFLLISHAVAGVLHVQICLSHFTMKTYNGDFNKFVDKRTGDQLVDVDDEPTDFVLERGGLDAVRKPDAEFITEMVKNDTPLKPELMEKLVQFVKQAPGRQFSEISLTSEEAKEDSSTGSDVEVDGETDLKLNSDCDEYVTENWVLLQLLTSMNVHNPESADWFHGGLNFQIEHHLYPRLPRHNLRIASYFVRALCRRHGIPYRSLTFIEANKELIERLRATATVAKNVNESNGGGVKIFKESTLCDGLNCIG